MAAEKHILVALLDGLHCISLETGNELWHFTDPDGNIGGKTPAVDQDGGFIYFQTNNRLHKLNARNGQRLDFVAIAYPNKVVSGNTILVDDENGYHVLTFWYRSEAYGMSIKCYDENLDFEWEVTGLNSTYKNSITYHGGLVFIGTGETYGISQPEYYEGELENLRVIAYSIVDGSVEWETVLSDPADKIYEPMGYGILNVIYCNGYIICETDSGIESCPLKVFVLDVTDGSVLKTYEGETYSSSCAGVSFSYGRLISGDLVSKRVKVYQIGPGVKTDFAPFGIQQTNTMEADDTALASLDEAITFVGSVEGGDQGSCIHNGIVYVAYGVADGTHASGIIAFDIETLAVIRWYPTDNSYDASPLVVAAQNGDLYLLIHENVTERVICRRVDDGSLVWYANNLPSNVIFGLTYFESDTYSLINGMTSAEILTAINNNFTSLNALIADAATIITITSSVQWDDINANIASLNTEGVAVDVETITIGMTGKQFNDIINGFTSDFNLANS